MVENVGPSTTTAVAGQLPKGSVAEHPVERAPNASGAAVPGKAITRKIVMLQGSPGQYTKGGLINGETIQDVEGDAVLTATVRYIFLP